MLRLALTNLARRQAKTLVTVVVSALLVASTVLTWSLYSLVADGLALSEQRLGADVIVYPQDAQVDSSDLLFTGVQQMAFMDQEEVTSFLPAQDIEQMTAQFFVETKPGEDCCSTDLAIRIVGVDPSTDFILEPWLKSTGIVLDETHAVVGSSLENMLGSKTFMLGSLLESVGMLYPTGTGMDESVFVDIDVARAMCAANFDSKVLDNRDPAELATCILVKLHEGVDPDEFAERVASKGIPAQVASVPAARRALEESSFGLLSLLAAFACIVFVVGAIALFAHFYNQVANRASEIGYLRALGLGRSSVMGLFALEAGLAGLLGGVVGAALGFAALQVALPKLQQATVIPQGMQDAAFVGVHAAGGIALAVAICVVAALVWAYRVARLDPSTAIAKGEL